MSTFEEFLEEGAEIQILHHLEEELDNMLEKDAEGKALKGPDAPSRPRG